MSELTDDCATAYATELESSFADLLALFGELSPAAIESATAGDGWTPKTLLAHVAFWDAYQTRRMEAALAGASAAQGFPRPETDNDTRFEQDGARAWTEVLSAAQSARAQMVTFARGLDEAALTADLPEGDHTLSLARLLRHMINHTNAHAADLQRVLANE